MEIFYCAFMERGLCKHSFSGSGKGDKPSGARVDFVGPGEVLLCTQAGSDDKERIVCDKKVLVR